MKLYYREYGTYSDQRPTLILLHGLLGSSSNWHSIARRLEGDFHIIVPDLRNHGRSPHSGDVSYPALAADLSELLDEHGLDSVLLVGHSMGGKAAMWLALEWSERVAGLVVVDIAPINYSNRFSVIYDVLQQLDLSILSDRDEADELLSSSLPERGLRQYLLQNLVQESGQWRWRMNLEGLQAGMDDILIFPEHLGSRQYPGKALFIHGSESDYVTAASGETVQRYFPFSRFRSIPGAGHWVYSEQPDAFLTALTPFLKQTV
ncbi:MAG: alpha/beta fold hydrolase [Candidatus Sedimenticola sp. (ex Thyasira tokunagai)]